MSLFSRKPRVNALVRARNVDRLLAAARYSDMILTHDGQAIDRGLSVRAAAIEGLGTLSGERALEAAREALRDPADPVRTAAIRVLYAHEQAKPIAAALEWLPIRTLSLQIALDALQALRQPSSALALAGALIRRNDSEGKGPELDAIDILQSLVVADLELAPSVLQLLIDTLTKGPEEGARRAEMILIALGETSVETLIQQLENNRGAMRVAAVLGRIGDIRAVHPLVAALSCPDPRVRSASCTALGELRHPLVVEPLLHATSDEEQAVRISAGAALDRIGVTAIVFGLSAIAGASIGIPSVTKPAPGSASSATPFLSKQTNSEEDPNLRTAVLQRVGRLLDQLDRTSRTDLDPP